MLEIYIKLLELDYFELGEAFKGLKDENVWKRPADGLLSVGEVAGHMAYWQAIRLAGEGEDLSKCRINSPLIDPHFRYHPGTIEGSLPDHLRQLSAEQVNTELARVNAECLASLKAVNPDLDSKVPGMGDWTWRQSIEYLIFHIAYHTGQVYSARHLLGEETVDN